jgi:hypothetical protein
MRKVGAGRRLPWSDRRKHTFEELFTPDQLLTEVMLYLVTDAFPTSTWIYGAKRQEGTTLPPGRRVTAPTGLAAFHDPVFPMPPRRVAQLSHNVVHYTEMAEGGHPVLRSSRSSCRRPSPVPQMRRSLKVAAVTCNL